MAESYQATGGIRAFNKVMMGLARMGFGPSSVLTTTGRRTGLKRMVPVSPITIDGNEYLVSPYGEVDWVRNARSNPAVSLMRGSRTRSVHLVEVTEPKVVVAYHGREKFARRYMDLPDSPTEGDVEAKAGLFPVFRVDPV
jgi:deazaflavin-dependent oxidoreductase (nitroreductase family)